MSDPKVKRCSYIKNIGSENPGNFFLQRIYIKLPTCPLKLLTQDLPPWLGAGLNLNPQLMSRHSELFQNVY